MVSVAPGVIVVGALWSSAEGENMLIKSEFTPSTFGIISWVNPINIQVFFGLLEDTSSSSPRNIWALL